MNDLLAEVPLEERSIVLFGRAVLQPRLIGWAGARPYTYSGQTLEPREMGPCLRHLLKITNDSSGYEFNHALLNLYRHGRDSMGMHSDDEPELGESPPVASWSFGSTRRFVLTAKTGKDRHEIHLESGQLLLMEGRTQHEFRHGLPKAASVSTARLNVTFRRVL